MLRLSLQNSLKAEEWEAFTSLPEDVNVRVVREGTNSDEVEAMQTLLDSAEVNASRSTFIRNKVRATSFKLLRIDYRHYTYFFLTFMITHTFTFESCWCRPSQSCYCFLNLSSITKLRRAPQTRGLQSRKFGSYPT